MILGEDEQEGEGINNHIVEILGSEDIVQDGGDYIECQNFKLSFCSAKGLNLQ